VFPKRIHFASKGCWAAQGSREDRAKKKERAEFSGKNRDEIELPPPSSNPPRTKLVEKKESRERRKYSSGLVQCHIIQNESLLIVSEGKQA